MASRTVTPMLLRNALRISPRTVSSAPRRFLNTETAPSLYTAQAKVVGARVGYYITHAPRTTDVTDSKQSC